MIAPVWSKVIVDTSAPITISAQVSEQIKLLIAHRKLKSDDVLPTVTQLAKHLGVNHNTVAAIYSHLTETGYLVAQRGRGTFVANTQVVQNLINHQRLYNKLGEAFNAAKIAGFSSSEFAGTAYAQTVISQLDEKPLKLIFIDCLDKKADVYEAIKSEIKQDLLFLSLEDLKATQSKLKLLDADLVITTEQHILEVTELVAPQEVIKIDVKPDAQLLITIALKPRNALILLIDQEVAESEKMKKMLQQASISHVKYQTLGLEDIKKDPQLLEQASLICVYKKVKDYVYQHTPQPNKIMIFNLNLDETDMSVLKARLSTIQLVAAN